MVFLWWCRLLQPVKIVFWDQRHRFSSFLIVWKYFGELLGPYLAILAPMLPELAYAYIKGGQENEGAKDTVLLQF